MKYYVINGFGGSYDEKFSINIGVSTSLEKAENFVKEQERKLAVYKKMNQQIIDFGNKFWRDNGHKVNTCSMSDFYAIYCEAKESFIASLEVNVSEPKYQIFKNVDIIEYTEVEGIE